MNLTHYARTYMRKSDKERVKIKRGLFVQTATPLMCRLGIILHQWTGLACTASPGPAGRSVPDHITALSHAGSPAHICGLLCCLFFCFFPPTFIYFFCPITPPCDAFAP